MNQSEGTFLFLVAVVGNAVIITIGLIVGLGVVVWRGLVARRRRWLRAVEHDSAFHHPDKIRTPLGEWLFMGGAAAAVLVGLPVVLAALFQFLLPMFGRAWTH